jgi:DNA-binding MarR family transcriptional regulator
MNETAWLNDREASAWRGYRRMRLLLDLQLNRDLARDSGLSEADYDVLSHVSESADGRSRLTELAGHMHWSKSRLSHHITRMQQRGLVERRECATDGRGSVVLLTDLGRETIEAAAPKHVASVRAHLIDLLTPDELATLDALSHRIVGRLNAACDAIRAESGD